MRAALLLDLMVVLEKKVSLNLERVMVFVE
jgi:hypothetical protein